MKKNRSDHCVTVIAYVIVVLAILVIVIPLLHIVAVSVSDGRSVTASKVQLIPKDIQFRAYAYVLQAGQFHLALINTIILTGLGSLISMMLCTTAAYALAHIHLPGRKLLLLMYVFTMMFTGGIIPTFLLMTKLKLLNTYWSVIFVSCINVYNMLIIKNYFERLPEEIEESARIDGAGQLRIFAQISLPLAKPVLATVSLFFAVAFWNEYFNARLYLTTPSKITLQTYLRAIVFEASDPSGAFTYDTSKLFNVAPKTLVNATVVSAMIPICILYPFLQKYFVSGMVLGSVKG